MHVRFFFPLIALFWILMNVLLWRAEFGGARDLGSVVSTEVVWQKILTAPDDSTLEISWNGKKMGYCRWVPNVGEVPTAGRTLSDDFHADGRVKRLAGYTIELEGNLMVGDPPSRLRFSSRAEFSTNSVWEQMFLRLAMRPAVWELRAVAAEEKLSLGYEDSGEKWSRTFTFEELRDPRKLVEEFSGPLAWAWMAPLQGIEKVPSQKDLALGLQWEARNDSLKIGHSTARAYRLQARLVDRYQVVVLVSRVGEIMRVELPNGLLLVNEALADF
jgi:hypothetical protein